MNTKVEKLRRITSWIVAIVLLLIIIFSRNPFQGTLFYEFIEIIGFVFVTFATLGRIWCTIYIGGRKDQELCYDGPYSIVRNPLYIFSFLGLTGIICAAQNLTLLLIAIPIYWVYYFFVIKSEEKRLLKLFGQEYAEYCLKVKSIIPGFRHFYSRKVIEINPMILSKSISDASCFIWIFIFMEILENFKGIQFNGKSILPVLWQLPF